MNLNDNEFNDLCKGFETQNLNEGKENSIKIDEEVKLDEIPQVMSEENVSGKVEKVKETTYWCALFKQDGSLEAKEMILKNKLNKEYLSITGLAFFTKKVALLAYSKDLELLGEGRIAVTQLISSTGNHHAVFRDSGLEVGQYRYYDKSTNGLDFNSFIEDIQNAQNIPSFYYTPACIILLGLI
ncbi:8584_t:CDS:2 [Funneliformis geosporum]|nr:8584_t:CDS:2 [Funneliformis geosporum]